MNADKEYTKILRSVKKIVGNKTTWLQQLNSAGKLLLGTKFKGVFPSDHIPRLSKKKPYCILNLDRSTEPGSHWIALGKLPSGDSIVYDSFGRKYTEIIPKLTHSGNGKILNTDPDAEQDILETDCGARSLAWLVFLDKYGAESALKI